MPHPAARALKALKYGDADVEITVDEEVGFLLLADAVQMLRDFHGAYLTEPKGG